MLNKIKIGDKSIHLESNVYLLEINKPLDLEINIDKNNDTKLVITAFNNYNLKININDNANLIVNSLNIDNSSNIEINLYNKATITYNHSVSSKIDSINNFKINHLESNSQSFITNNGVNLSNNKLFFEINGIVPKKLNNIICNQSSKIINFNNGNSKIIPNLVIDSNDIIANHSSYIGEIAEDELFYLLSRGINEDKIKDLIYKAVLLGKMDLKDEKDLFNQIING